MVMRVNRFFSLTVAVALAGCLLVLVLSERRWRSPVNLRLAAIESSGLFDESGKDLWLVSFDITANDFYVKCGNGMVEVKDGNYWRPLRETSVMMGPDNPPTYLPRGGHYVGQILAPAGTGVCRFWLKFAAPVKRSSFKNMSEMVATRLPRSTRARISYKFWRWVGFPTIEPSSDWHDIELELPLQPMAPSRSG